ncbi:MAG: cytochrome c [Verrucomicrobiota bacterium]|nr:MAG: cytochrome c [Verrucomicrobiota bacterium]
MRLTFKSLACVLGLTLVSSIACADVTENWTKSCASCHGKDGGGHTKAGRMAGVKDLSNADYQNTFTDADAAKQIKDGLQDKNGKIRMKAFAETLSDSDIKDLVAYVRTLKK